MAGPATTLRPRYRAAKLFDEQVVEQELQAQVFAWLDSVALVGAEVFHVPNGRKLDRLEAAAVKRLGVKRGVYDLAVMLVAGRQGWIELKTDRGTESDDQRAFAALCERLGHRHGLARSVGEVQRILLDWGVRWAKNEACHAD